MLSIRGDEILEVMKLVDKTYNRLMEMNDKVVQEILLERSKYSIKLFRSCSYFAAFFLLFCMLNPLFEKNFVTPLHIPGIDENLYAADTIYWWILYLIQSVVYYYVLVLVIMYTSAFISFIQFGIAMIKILKYKINELQQFEEVGIKLNRKIISCIKLHLEILKYVE